MIRPDLTKLAGYGRTLCLAALVAMLWASVAPAPAQLSDQRRNSKRSQAESQPTSAESSQPTTTSTSTSTSTSSTSAAAEEEEDKPKWFAVTHGRVHTVTGPTLSNATVLCKDGVIVDVGDNLRLPDECEVLDATGREVYPGLIAVAAGGIHGGGDPRETTNVFGLNMRIALAGGITTAIAGNDAAKLTYGTLDGLLIQRGLFVNLAVSTRKPIEAAQMRADFEKVRAYMRDYARWQIDKQTDEDAEEPDKDWLKGKYENYRKLMTGEATAVATANTVAQMRPLLELARHFGFKLVLRGASEGWIIPEELARAGVMAVVTPRTDDQPDNRYNRTTGSSIENARILDEHGVTVAVVPATSFITLWGLAGRDLLHLNMEAAFAVRGGMTNARALRTITIDAARVLGIDDRVGSLEIGKDADMVVTDGPMLSYMTQVHHTVVNGRVAYDKSESTLYAHIRPEGRPIEVDFDDQWPRRLQWSPADLEATAVRKAGTPSSQAGAVLEKP
jgi:imidazolonepropionase-like amidohydrolase